MNGRTRGALFFAIGLAGVTAALAQSSATYSLTEEVVNSGGQPAQGVGPGSAAFRISLGSIGEPIANRTLSGASYRLDGGLIAAYPPPGEVDGLLVLVDQQTMTWSVEPGATAYNVYSGLLSSLPGGFGTCAVARVAGTTADDVTSPAPGTGLFYLVTAVNRLREEGSKGHTSSGAERANTLPCP
jgi:hypothetical protein